MTALPSRGRGFVFLLDRADAFIDESLPGSPLPQLSDDAGTPFALVVIPVDDSLAIRLRRR